MREGEEAPRLVQLASRREFQDAGEKGRPKQPTSPKAQGPELGGQGGAGQSTQGGACTGNPEISRRDHEPPAKPPTRKESETPRRIDRKLVWLRQ